MKTKTDSFTKFITFCVLALFLVTNMIFFTSCDNGNSPNNNTNEEQNNNAPTDYCEICDGVQTENCGIEHKCNDENCVEYADEKIYKNGHTHDYCENNDCDGSTHKNQAHPEYESWFQEAKIGGENSNICPMYVTEYTVNENNKLTTESVNNILDQYKKYVNNLNLDTTLSDGQIDFEAIKALTGANEPKKLDILISNINNVCTPAIEKITQNISSNNNIIEKNLFMLYYKAIDNEVYRIGYGYDDINNNNEAKAKYKETQNFLAQLNGSEILPFANKYFYNESGKLNPEVVTAFDIAIQTAATKMRIDANELYKVINLSLITSTIKGLHDDLSEVNALGNDIIDHTANDTCETNEMIDVISNTDLVATTKLNKSIFSQDMGRELV